MAKKKYETQFSIYKVDYDKSVKYFNEKLNLREKDYTMFSEEKINELTQVRRKIGASSVLGKIFKIFD